MPTPFLGEIRIFGGNFAPLSWALCNGQLLPIDQNSALFSLLGTTYGGDGTTNFALPNLQSRIPVHAGTLIGNSYILGQTGGVEQVALSTNQIPSHTHPVRATASAASNRFPTGAAPAKAAHPIYAPSNSTPVTMLPTALSNVGNNLVHDNIQPYLTLNFIIALQGIFPSRN